MNREGGNGTDEGGPPDEQAPPDNVIAFPRRPTLEVRGDTEPTPEAEAPRPPDEPSDQGMTLDAFERAVRSAVQDKLGELPGSPPRGADELVAQVFSALTGKDAKSALSEVRARLADPNAFEGPAREEGSVIDLGAVREARQKASVDTAAKLGNALKDTFGQFLASLAQRPGQSGEITLDAGFFKQHGPSLLGNLFQGLASALMQQARPPAPPSETSAAAPTQPPPGEGAPVAPQGAPPEGQSAPAAAAGPVQVKLDLGSILAGLFRRRDPPKPPAPPTTPQPTTPVEPEG